MINVIRGKDFDPNFLRIEDSKIKEIEKNVEFIIEEVKTKGDLALYDFSFVDMTTMTLENMALKSMFLILIYLLILL